MLRARTSIDVIYGSLYSRGVEWGGEAEEGVTGATSLEVDKKPPRATSVRPRARARERSFRESERC